MLLLDCPIPVPVEGMVNDDLARLTEELYFILGECNKDKKALRDFYGGPK